MASSLRLTQLSHKGGCGCKIPPSVLRSILGQNSNRSGLGGLAQGLLVGYETSDDAAVYRINDQQAIVATTDFFMPIVDDAFDFGTIAATNAISDIYAMGATPLFALAIVGMPTDKLPHEVIQRILAGGEDACARAGIAIAGGHTIDALEPMYGLVVIGIADPQKIKRNFGAKDGDAIILGKPLGVGTYCQALKKDKLSPAAYTEMLKVASQLNTPGVRLGQLTEVHALTDVTGFGLLGHLLEVCAASKLGASLQWNDIPFLHEASKLAAEGFVTGAAKNNWADYGEKISPADLNAVQRALLTDPQTSGGLLLACAPEASSEVLALFREQGFDQAKVIGRFTTAHTGVNLA